MPTLFVTTRRGETRNVPAAQDLSVMLAIRKAGIDDLLALCGGCCSCATCHVYVADDQLAQLPPMREDEDALLDGSNHRTTNSRLACQLKLSPALDGLSVTIAPED